MIRFAEIFEKIEYFHAVEGGKTGARDLAWE
jgi:hypothetical protein